MEGGIIELRFFVKRYERVSTLLNRVDKNHFGFVIYVYVIYVGFSLIL